MAKVWEEIGEGTLKLTISPDEGGSASVFYGKTRDEILDKVIDAQARANQRIDQLRASNGHGPNGHATAPPPSTDPRPLTPGERMQAVADLSNPATVDKAVSRVMESVIGPVEQFQRDREAERAERLREAAVAAAEEFAEQTPGYFPSDYNNNTLVAYMQRMGFAPNDVGSYKRAFADLSGAQLLQPKPSQAPDDEEPPTEPHERNATTLSSPRVPARYSTGVRQSDISGTAPVPVKRLKWSREQIANMSASEFRRHVNDPEFNFCVEYYTKAQKRKAVAAV